MYLENWRRQLGPEFQFGFLILLRQILREPVQPVSVLDTRWILFAVEALVPVVQKRGVIASTALTPVHFYTDNFA